MLKIDEKALGTDHPEVATDLNNLALLLQAQNKYTESEPLLRRAVQIFETVLGASHPNTIQVRDNLEGLQEKMSEW